MLDGPLAGSGSGADGYTPDVSGPLTGVDPESLAVVLAGGGTVGIGWELSVLIGLEAEGVALGGANRIIGTSAGSIVGALLGSGVPLLESGRRLLSPNPALAIVPPAAELRAEVTARWSAGPLTRTERAELGRIALDAPTVPLEAWLGRIETTLDSHVWPAALVVTAVDAENGMFRGFDATAGVPLAAAVAASCTIPGWFPPVPIAGRRWIDGGLRSMTNADLARPAGRIVVIAAFRRDGRSLHRLEAELAPARAAGARIAIVLPEQAFLDATSADSMDPRHLALAGATGVADGRQAAAEVRAVIDRSAVATAPSGRSM
jgi:NTE family protein